MAVLAPPVPLTRPRPGLAPSGWLVLAAVAALALALRVPVATAVLGLVGFGVLHNVLELRYVTGRFDTVLAGPFLALLVALITGVMVCRLLPPGNGSRAAEIGLSYVLLAVACVRTLAAAAPRGSASRWPCWRSPPRPRSPFPRTTSWFSSHLHNVVPLFFLWEWSGGLRPGRRGLFRAVNVGWVLVVPGLILSGAFDPLLRAAPAALGGLGSFEVAGLVRTYAPPSLVPTDLGVRFLVVFAFMQTMHYVVWVGVLPRYAPEAAARFDARVPLLRGGRAWLLGIGLAGVLAVAFLLDYANGKSLYAAAASYHAYLEFPVLLALVFSTGVRR